MKIRRKAKTDKIPLSKTKTKPTASRINKGFAVGSWFSTVKDGILSENDMDGWQ